MDNDRNTNNNPNQNPYMLNKMLVNPQMQILLTQMLQGLQNQQNQTREKILGEYMAPVIGESPFKIVLPQVPGFKLTHNLLNHLPRFDGRPTENARKFITELKFNIATFHNNYDDENKDR